MESESKTAIRAQISGCQHTWFLTRLDDHQCYWCGRIFETVREEIAEMCEAINMPEAAAMVRSATPSMEDVTNA
jgi:hypothetical protein